MKLVHLSVFNDATGVIVTIVNIAPTVSTARRGCIWSKQRVRGVKKLFPVYINIVICYQVAFARSVLPRPLARAHSCRGLSSIESTSSNGNAICLFLSACGFCITPDSVTPCGGALTWPTIPGSDVRDVLQLFVLKQTFTYKLCFLRRLEGFGCGRHFFCWSCQMPHELLQLAVQVASPWTFLPASSRRQETPLQLSCQGSSRCCVTWKQMV